MFILVNMLYHVMDLNGMDCWLHYKNTTIFVNGMIFYKNLYKYNYIYVTSVCKSMSSVLNSVFNTHAMFL